MSACGSYHGPEQPASCSSLQDWDWFAVFLRGNWLVRGMENFGRRCVRDFSRTGSKYDSSATTTLIERPSHSMAERCCCIVLRSSCLIDSRLVVILIMKLDVVQMAVWFWTASLFDVEGTLAWTSAAVAVYCSSAPPSGHRERMPRSIASRHCAWPTDPVLSLSKLWGAARSPTDCATRKDRASAQWLE